MNRYHPLFALPLLLSLLAPAFSFTDDKKTEKEQLAVLEVTHSTSEIKNVVVEMQTGMIFFSAGDHHYIWSVNPDIPANLSTAFDIVDQFKKASQIEVFRLEGNNRPQSSQGKDRKGVFHYYLTELRFVYGDV